MDEIAPKIPFFERLPFAIDPSYPSRPFVSTPPPPSATKAQQLSLFFDPSFPGNNKYYDLIVRKPHVAGDVAIPVGIVSKRYRLVQHTELLETVIRALENASIDLSEVLVELTLTEYAGRMRLRLIFPPSYDFDPGDGYPMALRLECFNSVDRSTPLRVMLGWFRFVCTNGLVLGTAQLNMRLIHNEFLHLPDVNGILSEGLTLVAQDQEACREWLFTPIDQSRLVNWIDGPLARKWGVLAAARTYHITKTGYDGIPVDRFEKAPPHRKTMKSSVKVPGAPPRASNAFEISQALAWLAQERRDVQEQVDRMREIPDLMKTLLKP